MGRLEALQGNDGDVIKKGQGAAAGAAAAAGSGGGGGSTMMAAEVTEFKRALRHFTTLGSTYAEMESLKGLIDMLVKLGRGAGGASAGASDGKSCPGASAGGIAAVSVTKQKGGPRGGALDDSDCVPDPAFEEAVGLFLGLLFLANSRPLHRHLITSVRRFPPNARVVAEAALDGEVAAAIGAVRGMQGVHGASKLRPMTTLASINGCQPQTGMEQRVLRRAAVPAAALIAEGEALFLIRLVFLFLLFSLARFRLFLLFFSSFQNTFFVPRPGCFFLFFSAIAAAY